MPLRIEDDALVRDCRTAARAGDDGGIDCLRVPRDDSPPPVRPENALDGTRRGSVQR